MRDATDRAAMRPFTELTPLASARDTASRLVRVVNGADELPTATALDRVLAEDVVSRIDVPSADRAAMDGFAVRAGEGLQPGARIRRIGRLAAGQQPGELEIGAGTCVEIATGAPIPAGADAVVPVEDTDVDADTVHLRGAVTPGQHIARRGEDLRRDRPIGRRDDVLSPALLAACAAGGCERVRVWARPRILIAPTGDEVVPLGQPLEPGQVYDSNALGLAGLVERVGGRPERSPVVVDERARLLEILDRPGADLIVTIGGTSVGRRDLVSDAVEERGQVLVHGVAVKPGKPLLLGQVGDVPVVGLPGFPTTCMMLGYAVLAPMVRAMGHRPVAAPRRQAILGEDVTSPPDKTRLLPVAVEDDVARSTFRASSSVSSMARATGWIEIEAGTEHLPAGEPVTVHLF